MHIHVIKDGNIIFNSVSVVAGNRFAERLSPSQASKLVHNLILGEDVSTLPWLKSVNNWKAQGGQVPPRVAAAIEFNAKQAPRPTPVQELDWREECDLGGNTYHRAILEIDGSTLQFCIRPVLQGNRIRWTASSKSHPAELTEGKEDREFDSVVSAKLHCVIRASLIAEKLNTA